MKASRRIYTLILLTAGIIVGLVIAGRFDTQELILAEKTQAPKETAELLDQFSATLSRAASEVTPSIVSISSTRSVKMEDNQLNDLFNDPFFRRFFGDRFTPPSDHPREFKESGLGSGVIVTEDGYILTNNHVVQDADKLVVTFADGDEEKGNVIGTDPKSDLALIKIDRNGLPAIKIGDSDTLKTGEIVLAVGIPFGLSQTVTMGIVSAVGRSNVGIVDYEDFIQTDAAINPGNSGGALVNTRSELVGINTAIFSTSGGYMGVGFAIPIKMAKSIMQSLIEHGKVVRGWLGVSIQNITPSMAEHFKLAEQGQGVLIADVGDDTPAAKAGIQRGDIVVSIDGNKVKTAAELKNLAAATSPGTEMKLTVIRAGEKKEIMVTLGEFPEKNMAAAGREAKENVFKGIHVSALDATSRSQLNLPETITGVLVSEVERDSIAFGALQRGDIIRQINQRDIETVADFVKLTKDLGSEKNLLVLIYRNGSHLFLTLSS